MHADSMLMLLVVMLCILFSIYKAKNSIIYIVVFSCKKIFEALHCELIQGVKLGS